jgi:hypothetical protein
MFQSISERLRFNSIETLGRPLLDVLLIFVDSSPVPLARGVVPIVPPIPMPPSNLAVELSFGWTVMCVHEFYSNVVTSQTNAPVKWHPYTLNILHVQLGFNPMEENCTDLTCSAQ